VAVAIVTAVDYEFDAVAGLLTASRPSTAGGRQLVEGTFDGARVVAIHAGYGKARAAGATALVIERYHPARIGWRALRVASKARPSTLIAPPKERARPRCHAPPAPRPPPSQQRCSSLKQKVGASLQGTMEIKLR
jgi:hypothetical protein